MEIIYILCIFLCLLNRSDARQYFSCQNTQFPRDCRKVIECSDEEYCFTEQEVTAGGNVVFNTGCLHKSGCSPTGILLIGKRTANTKRSTSISTCIECCCQNDFCNRNGCGTREIPRPQRGSYCFSCDAVVDAKACNNVTVCDKNEVCMLYSPVIYDSFKQAIYRGQCERKSVCDIVSKTLNNHNCSPLCCNTDFCNDHCGINPNITRTTAHPQTTLQASQSSGKPTAHTTQTQHPAVDLSTQGATGRTTIHTSNYIRLQSSQDHLCVHIVNSHFTWHDARHACKLEGGDLVVLDTHRKAALMRRTLTQFDLKGFWIGARDFNQDGHFTWINDDPVHDPEADWGHGQPDHHNNGEVQNCVVMLLSDSYQWQVTICEQNNFSYICERRCKVV